MENNKFFFFFFNSGENSEEGEPIVNKFNYTWIFKILDKKYLKK